MATLEVYEMAGLRGNVPIRTRPLLAKQVLTIGSTTATSAAFNPSTFAITIVSSGACRVNIGLAPTSTGNHEYIPAETPVDFAVSPGHKIIALSSTST